MHLTDNAGRAEIGQQQGLKLTLLGRCQLGTRTFFQSADGKIQSPKSVNKLFPSQ